MTAQLERALQQSMAQQQQAMQMQLQLQFLQQQQPPPPPRISPFEPQVRQMTGCPSVHLLVLACLARTLDGTDAFEEA